eukprot:1486201-Pyramimonas_sp.AAC.1
MVFWGDGIDVARGLVRVKKTADCTLHGIFHSQRRGIMLCLGDAAHHFARTKVALALKLDLMHGGVLSEKISDER